MIYDMMISDNSDNMSDSKTKPMEWRIASSA